MKTKPTILLMMAALALPLLASEDEYQKWKQARESMDAENSRRFREQRRHAELIEQQERIHRESVIQRERLADENRQQLDRVYRDAKRLPERSYYFYTPPTIIKPILPRN